MMNADMKLQTQKWLVLLVIVVIAAVGIYAIANMLNPNSSFCLYSIYKQRDGTYQVWFSGRAARTVELSGATYEQAKAFQIKQCDELGALISNGPKWEKVK